MRDPYEILGIRRTASESEIKSAYRLLAKRYHPDVDPGNATTVERFKEVTAAYEFLKDPIRRSRFDRGEIDASGALRRRANRTRPRAARTGDTENAGARPRNGHAGSANGTAANGSGTNGSGRGRNGTHHAGADPDDGYSNEPAEGEDAVRSRYHEIFADFFGGVRSKNGGPGPDSLDQAYRVTVSFEEAALGAKRRLRLTGDRKVDVKIPAGVRDGQQIRLKGMGKSSGAVTGDAQLSIEVAPHPYFKRQNNDVLLTLPVTLVEAVLGAKVLVPTINGAVQVTVPPGSNTGRTLRLKGRGIKPEKAQTAGDQLVMLQIVLPDDPPKDFVKTVMKWADKWPGSVRQQFGQE